MRSTDRLLARKALDKRLSPLRSLESFARPQRGWVKAIREALGMTTAQLGARIGVSQPRAVEIEKAEVSGSISLDSLERAAHALDCQLVYALIPKKPLEALIGERAQKIALRRLKSAAHSMALEDQSLEKTDELEQLRDLARKLAEKSSSELWRDE